MDCTEEVNLSHPLNLKNFCKNLARRPGKGFQGMPLLITLLVSVTPGGSECLYHSSPGIVTVGGGRCLYHPSPWMVTVSGGECLYHSSPLYVTIGGLCLCLSTPEGGEPHGRRRW